MFPSVPIAIERTALPGFNPVVNLADHPSRSHPTDRTSPVAEPEITVRSRLNLSRIGTRSGELDDLPERRRTRDCHGKREHGGEQRYQHYRR